MHRCIAICLALAGTLPLAAGCGKSVSESPTTVTASPEFRLIKEPEGAIEVLDVRDQAQDGAPVVVVGRLGGGINPWVEGRAAFLMVDTRILPSCDESGHCTADCPDCAKEMMAASTMVKFVDQEGRVLPVDARKLLGVNEAETVVVQGITKRDKTGNVSIAAEGIFIRR